MIRKKKEQGGNPAPSPMELVLSKLPDAKPCGKGFSAKCPAHDDRKPSLGIREGDDGVVLLKCLAGCSIEGVLAALGLAMEDLFPQTASHRKQQTVNQTNKPKTPKPPAFPSIDAYVASLGDRCGGHWIFNDDAGNPVLITVRINLPEGGKEFRQLHPVPGGVAFGGVDGKTPLLYLSDLQDADPLYVFEGERCADMGRTLGYPSTTWAGGCEAASKTDWSVCAGKTVFLFPDNDDGGEKACARIAGHVSSLQPPARVKLVRLPGLRRGGDIFDYVEARDCHDTSDIRRGLDELVEGTPWYESLEKPDGQEVLATDLRVDAHELDENAKKVSQAELLVRLALEHYRLGVDDRGEPFAVRKCGPNIALLFKGSREALGASLSKLFRQHHKKTPSTNALTAAMTCLSGEALDTAPEPTFQRVAQDGDSIVIDLGDSTGRCVVVSAGGWRVVTVSPVLFRRTALTAPMPEPTLNGDLKMLRALVNLTDETWPLLLGWLIAALIPWIEHPILMLGGQAGSGKTTAAMMIIGLCDASTAPVRSQPRDPEAWAISAAGSWAVCIDNVSTIPDWFSDSLCKAVTGDGWLRRKLYTDGELVVISFRRAIILTSIDAGALRGDLGNRLVLIDLEPIEAAARKPRKSLDDDYTAKLPSLFGALLDLLAEVLQKLPHVQLDQHPRMGDFGRVLAALDSILGTESLKSYMGQCERIAEDVVEADDVAKAIMDLLDKSAGVWTGTMGDLLGVIKPEHPPKGWPDSIPRLRGRLKRAATPLEVMGIHIERGRDKRSRWVTIQSGTRKNVTNVTSVIDPLGEQKNGHQEVTMVEDGIDGHRRDRHPENHSGVMAGQAGDSDDDDAHQIPAILTPSMGDVQETLRSIVPDGWISSHWAERLEYLASGCEALNPELAAQHRNRAAAIRMALNS